MTFSSRRRTHFSKHPVSDESPVGTGRGGPPGAGRAFQTGSRGVCVCVVDDAGGVVAACGWWLMMMRSVAVNLVIMMEMLMCVVGDVHDGDADVGGDGDDDD
eukprot:9155261-Pyramimonas_sp.AAC.1